MIDVHITRWDNGTRGRYEARIAGQDAASELTYTRRQDGVVIADHTFVPEALRGRGIAAAMVDKLVADARAEPFKIVPLCAYIKAQFKRHPEWSALLQVNGETPDTDQAATT